MDVKGYRAIVWTDVKGYSVDVESYSVDGKGYGVDVKARAIVRMYSFKKNVKTNIIKTKFFPFFFSYLYSSLLVSMSLNKKSKIIQGRLFTYQILHVRSKEPRRRSGLEPTTIRF